MARQELRIFTLTGRTMLLWMQTTPTNPTYVPGQLFNSDQDLPDSGLTQKYIRGKFEETDAESSGPEGKFRSVKGVIYVPMLYKAYLAQAEYIDPYLDGSRFKKSGAIVDEGRMFVTQSIESVSLTDPTNVVF
jgi:hypothetical protein